MDYKFGIGFALISLLCGCSMISDRYREFAPDRDTEYLEEEAEEPLELPEGMTMYENYHSPYIIPAGELPGEEAEPANLVPPGGLPLWDRANEELERTKARVEAREKREAEEEAEENDDE